METQSTPIPMRTLVAGLGVTGLSVAHYLKEHNEPFAVWDVAPKESVLEQLRADCPQAPVHRGEPDLRDFEAADTVIVSPGVSLDHPALRAARASGAHVYGDIELFAREVNAPVLGITGSNGKSTTTRLVAHLLEADGVEVAAGGNLGTPALSLLHDPAPDAYVLELSSFQLEATETLHCRAAGLINISPDHLDRHGTFEAYREAKHRLYRYTEVAVFNRDDPNTRPGVMAGRSVSFGLDTPLQEEDFGLHRHDGQDWLCRGRKRLLPCAEIPLAGRHNQANALAALALVEAWGVDSRQVAEALRSFVGLPHRLQQVAEVNGVRWFDDSKATNLSALQAALSVFESPCILIAGGRAKREDPASLKPVLKRHACTAVVFGEAAGAFAAAWQDGVPVVQTETLAEAVQAAAGQAGFGDCVLLSPGCSSHDQYTNFEARGKDFVAQVRALGAAA